MDKPGIKKCLSCREVLTKENTYYQANGNNLRSYCRVCTQKINYENRIKRMSEEEIEVLISSYREVITKNKAYIMNIKAIRKQS